MPILPRVEELKAAGSLGTLLSIFEEREDR